ncbi:MAG: cytochrome c biogenesis protein CcdA, partial [Gemmatimonadaceae bacterium]|nr:cytochrome c biogenesis protein CcdA [Gemmatimonadaceae bacterium]NUR19896.1 cytochrome c biogenesis protein CcdA [Gemmatimonadaceae bacterium]NUS96094.1 cytochrome c biogenesis protein CcdA [Gemmatimonadaceae bacterium]
MESSATLGVAIAFTAGVLSFLSPCVLPLVPSYVTFVTGLSIEDMSRSRRMALVHSLLFVSGFTAIFVAMGAGATAIGVVLALYRDWISRIGGMLLILFGLVLLEVIRVPALARDRRIYLADKPVGYLGSVLVGVAFGAGWTPCIGPVLGGILSLASASASMSRGVALLFAYSAGLAIPFLLAALAIERFIEVFARMRRGLAWVSRISGVLLILVGILLAAGWFTMLATWLQRLTPAGLQGRL